MKKHIGIIITFIIEISLLLVVFLLFFVGLVGIFLPILPGLAAIALGLALYFFLLKDENNKLTSRFHRFLLKVKGYFINLKNKQNFMGLIKTIKKKKREKIKEEIIKDGLILLGFNLAITLALFFTLTAVTILISLLNFGLIIIAFVPLLVIFLFAGTCAIIWYRFGQILGQRPELKKKKILYSGAVVLISVVPLLLILFFLSIIITAKSILFDFLGTIFMVTTLTTTLAVIFEMLIVSLGVITKE